MKYYSLILVHMYHFGVHVSFVTGRFCEFECFSILLDFHVRFTSIPFKLNTCSFGDHNTFYAQYRTS